MTLTKACCALTVFAAVACAQMSTSTLRSKYGPPLSRETFILRPGLAMVVDYAISGQVCQLKFPASINVVGVSPPGVVTHKMVDDALEEVVPAAIRGKEIVRLSRSAGLISFWTIEYDFVSISEVHNTNTLARREGVTVTFKNHTCLDTISPNPRN